MIAGGCGTLSNAYYPYTATRDGFQITNQAKTVVLQLSNLVAGTTYNATVFGSHMYQTNSGIAVACNGYTQKLVTAWNVSNTITVSAAADTSGVLRFQITPWPRAGTVYGVMNVLDITYTGFTAPAPNITLSTNSLTLPSRASGATQQATNTFKVQNFSPASMSFGLSSSAPWLTASPYSGSSVTGMPITVTVFGAASNLSAGTYAATVTVFSAQATNSPQKVLVTFPVSPAAGQAQLSVAPTGFAVSVTQGQDATPSAYSVWNSGSGTLTYTNTSSTNWLSAAPLTDSSSGGPRTNVVMYNTAGLAAGDVHGACNSEFLRCRQLAADRNREDDHSGPTGDRTEH